MKQWKVREMYLDEVVRPPRQQWGSGTPSKKKPVIVKRIAKSLKQHKPADSIYFDF
jgi:hypothetical protein